MHLDEISSLQPVPRLPGCHGQDVGLLLQFMHCHSYMYQHQMEHSRDDAGTCHEQRGVTLSDQTVCRGAAFEIVAASLEARGAFISSSR